MYNFVINIIPILHERVYVHVWLKYVSPWLLERVTKEPHVGAKTIQNPPFVPSCHWGRRISNAIHNLSDDRNRALLLFFFFGFWNLGCYLRAILWNPIIRYFYHNIVEQWISFWITCLEGGDSIVRPRVLYLWRSFRTHNWVWESSREGVY